MVLKVQAEVQAKIIHLNGRNDSGLIFICLVLVLSAILLLNYYRILLEGYILTFNQLIFDVYDKY
jgi:hypothetical protein